MRRSLASELTAAKPRWVEVFCEGGHVFGSYGNVVLCISRASPSRALLQGAVVLARELSTKYPLGVAILVVIEAACPPPEEEARKAVQETYRALQPMVRGAAYVVEGEGFAAAAKRGALALINMTVRAGFPIKVCGTVNEALPWLQKTVGPAWADGVETAKVADLTQTLRPRLAGKH